MKRYCAVLVLLLCFSVPCFAQAPQATATEVTQQNADTAARFQNYITQFNATLNAPAMQFATGYASRLTSQQLRTNAELQALGESISRLEELYPPLYGAHQKYTRARDAYATTANADTAAALAAACVELNSRLADAEAVLVDIATQAEVIYTRYGTPTDVVAAQLADYQQVVEATLASPAVQFARGYIARVFPAPNSPLSQKLAAYSDAMSRLSNLNAMLAQKATLLRRGNTTVVEANRLRAEIRQGIADAEVVLHEIKSISEDLYARYGNSN